MRTSTGSLDINLRQGSIASAMNIQIDAKAHYQSTFETAKKELAQVSQSGNFHLSVIYAHSEWVRRWTPTPEQIIGVQEFLDVLLNLPFPEEKVPIMQTKTLDHGLLNKERQKPTR